MTRAYNIIELLDLLKHKIGNIYLRGLKRVIRRKMNRNQKHASCIRAIGRPHNCCLPMEHVLGYRTWKNKISSIH